MRLRPCEPHLRQTATGWLAATPADYPYRIGVEGSSDDEARRRFAAAFAAWDELHSREDQSRSVSGL